VIFIQGITATTVTTIKQTTTECHHSASNLLPHRKDDTLDTSDTEGCNPACTDISKWIFRKWDVRIWTGLSWLRIETGGRHL
jgi:hypothetical protein